MAHPQQLCFIGTLSRHLSDDYAEVRILEIGSYDVNGGVRNFFPGSRYTGTDLVEGPGVDLVADGHLIDHDDNSYAITISCECFEHNPYWRETFLNMHRMTAAGGFVIFTCATRGRLEHGTRRTSPRSSPGTQDVGWDYYRNLEARDFVEGMQLETLFDTHVFLTNKSSRDLYFVGRKAGGNSPFRFDRDLFLAENREQQERIDRSARAGRSWYAKAFSPFLFLMDLPCRLAQHLPDRHFQNFAIPYSRFVEASKKPMRKLFRAVSRTGPTRP